MVKLAYLNGIIIEASENALSHELNVIDTRWKFKAVQLCELIQAPYSYCIIIACTYKQCFLLWMYH